MFKFAIILQVICVLHGTSSESLNEGARRENDVLLHRSEHIKWPIYFTIRYDDVAFPKYDEEDGFLITAINVLDNIKDGGSSEVDTGGVGHTFVNVHLRSHLGQGFNFTVEIYGVKINGRVFMFPSELVGKEDNVTASNWNQAVQEQPIASGVVGNNFNPKLYKTVKRYSCFFAQDTELLLLGSKAWTFPEQDVELKLSYPSENMVDESAETFTEHIVTGVDVVLYTGGRQRKAFISSGGMLQKTMSLTFLCENTTSLGYEFRVYGWPQNRIDVHRSSDIEC